ncbi:MAG: hypothetical protein ACLQIQ_12200 [Beijerinckiaceae bacterium]
MSYLDPPPPPAPVVVMKDVGGIVNDYQAVTEFYRSSDREVRLHECRSACTLALALPNVCVYPSSILKFHQAYSMHTHKTDFGVSQQMFDSYPPGVRARLGTLTRNYKVLSGAELIALGIRNCNEPRLMLAARTPPQGQMAGLSQGLSGVLSGTWMGIAAAPAPGESRAGFNLLAARTRSNSAENLSNEILFAAVPPALPTSDEETTASNEQRLPPLRPDRLSFSYTRPLDSISLPSVMRGAQPILPAHFVAYAEIARPMR